MARILIVLFGLLAPVVAGAQAITGEANRDQIQAEVRRYHLVIFDYRHGAADAVDQILRWDRKRVLRVLASIGTTKDEFGPWGVVRFKAAAMLHTDVALRLREQSEMEAALLHLDIASQFLKKAGPDVHPYVGRWYQAVARLLRHDNELSAAERVLESGRQRWPHEPAVLFESGRLQELLASETVLPVVVVYLVDLNTGPRSTNAAASQRTAPLTKGDVDEMTRRRAGRLTNAAGWFRESLKVDPSNRLARLHLGRVQTLRNQNDALELLQQAATAEDPAVAYLALLFSAALHERNGRLDAAAQAYLAAIERYPLNHAAHVALSALLQRSGRVDESRARLGRVLDATAGSRREPWWSYLNESFTVSLERFEQLRREARQ